MPISKVLATRRIVRVNRRFAIFPIGKELGMLQKFVAFSLVVGAVGLLSGCSVGGAASTGLNVFRNTKSNKLDVNIYVDGQLAKRNEMKQAVTGASKYKLAAATSVSPTFKYEARTEGVLGRISGTNIQIHKMLKDKPSDQAEFIIFSTTQTPESQLQPGTQYNLASLPGNFRTQNWRGETVSGVTLEPATDYMLVFTVRADDSETAQIYFTTK